MSQPQKFTPKPFATRSEQLPELLPLFPLSGVLLLPHGRLPLNIFEPRYLAMIEHALGNGRLIGMVQPTGATNPDGTPEIFRVGCAGRIHSFNESEDGRYLISLLGVSRFRIRAEAELQNGFRRAHAAWDEFADDLAPPPDCSIDREALLSAMRCFFKLQGYAGDWEMIEKTDNAKLISSLAMICPFCASEKQALLEAPTHEERCRLLKAMMEMAICGEQCDAPAESKH